MKDWLPTWVCPLGFALGFLLTPSPSLSLTGCTGRSLLPCTEQPCGRGRVAHLPSAMCARWKPILQPSRWLKPWPATWIAAPWEALNRNDSDKLLLDSLLSETVWDNKCLLWMARFGGDVFHPHPQITNPGKISVWLYAQFPAQPGMYVSRHRLNKYLLNRPTNPDSCKLFPGTFCKKCFVFAQV